jgi:plastocyanin
MTNDRKSKIVPMAGLAAMAILAASIAASQVLTATAQNSAGNEDKPSWIYRQEKKYFDYQDGVMRIKGGSGGPVAPLTWFFPKNAEIKVGETVVWYNPTKVSEPHTITFIKNPDDFAPLEAPFIISNSSALLPLDPSMNADPTLIPGPADQTVAIIANARAYAPVAITDGQAQYLPLNANYTMTGDESYVNSGFMWPEGQVPPGLSEITSFSVKFEEAGTYDYLCLIHPWMAGRVVVK